MRLLFTAAAFAAGLFAAAPAQAQLRQYFDCSQAPASRAFGGNENYRHYVYIMDNKDNLTIINPAGAKQSVKILGGGRTDEDGAPGLKWITKDNEYDLRWEASVKKFAFSAIPQNSGEPQMGVCEMSQKKDGAAE